MAKPGGLGKTNPTIINVQLPYPKKMLKTGQKS
jgi:hypothetical protein